MTRSSAMNRCLSGSDQTVAPDPPPAVVVDGVSFTYPNGYQALHNIELSVAPGEKVALVGANGAGKSTLLLHLNGVLGQLDGRVRIAGLPVIRASLRRVRALVGLVFQDPDDQLFSPTVFDDVAFGPLHMGLPEAEVRARVARALAQVGMQGYEARMPHHLSLGQRKRVALATVLAMDPAVLALDEPSAGLDPRARRGLITLLRALPQTLLVATHDLRLVAEILPRAVVLDAGRVAYDGPSARLLNDTALLERFGLEL
ncbi:energy-coupling factor ABC transporter ATP-binding protein [Kallotenue papyrolyticum]|uniref:energy-coupling factor ABC transporter ATP-binding protein n=1 Tax=Kallotenue papyrolyticum TaxID=1325125 RepID=UPI0023EB438D|nr:ABC transporter ATP-binding protein [Kallotenue papyrolyticum]